MDALVHCQRCGALPLVIALTVPKDAEVGYVDRYYVECRCGRMTLNYEDKSFAVAEWKAMQAEARQQRFLGEG